MNKKSLYKFCSFKYSTYLCNVKFGKRSWLVSPPSVIPSHPVFRMGYLLYLQANAVIINYNYPLELLPLTIIKTF